MNNMAKYNWIPVEEMDLEDGTHTCYAAETDEWFLWLTQISDDTWDVEAKRKCRIAGESEHFIQTVANCKSLTSAKRWVSRYW